MTDRHAIEVMFTEQINIADLHYKLWEDIKQFPGAANRLDQSNMILSPFR